MRPALIGVVVLLNTSVVMAQTATSAQFSTSHLYYASRLVGALLIATLVPLLIDRRARRSSRVRR